MALSTRPIVNFAGGEASPSLKGRSDTVPYYAMAETLENVLVTHYGSAGKTPGTQHIARTKTMSENARLIPFTYSSGQSYIIELGDLYMRFYRNGGSLVEAAVAITGVTAADPAVVTTGTAHGYTNGDAVDIEDVVGMTQLNEKRFLVASATSNTFELQDEDGVDIDSSGYTAYSSAGTAEKIYEVATPWLHTQIADIKFTQQADVMYLVHPLHEPRKLSRTGTAVFTLSTITYDDVVYPPFLAVNATETTITPSATTGVGITLTASASLFSADHVGTYFQIDHASTLGYAKITAFTSDTQVTATVIVDFGATTASAIWYEGAWSDYQGWPSDVKFYEQRLYYSATTLRPLTLWGSKFGEFENFEQGADDDDSVAYTLGSAQVDKIRWMYPTSILNCGTAGGPFTLSSGTTAVPITPSNISVKQQNENGSSTVSPVRIGSFVYYTERSDKVLGQFAYSLDFDSYITENITYLSDHILGESGVKEMALQRYPYNILWCVRNDGEIATLTREIKNDVKGWSRQVMAGTGAAAESVSVIPYGTEDQVWMVVKRTINGGTKRYVEYVKPHYVAAQADSWFVQSGIEYDSTPATVISGLDHLEGETVQILADGAVRPEQTVSSGAITLTTSASHVIVGLGYTATIQTMDIGVGNAQQTAQAKVTHIGKVSIRFLNSLGCKFGNGTTTDIIPFRDSSMAMDEGPDLFTGDKEVEFPSGHEKNKYIYLYQEQALPMNILGIYPRMLISF